MVSEKTDDAKLRVIYYAYIDRRSNWKQIIAGQLLQMNYYGIFENSILYIHVTDPSNTFEDVRYFIQQICPLAKISYSSINQYEYDALKLVYDLAKLDSEAIYIYFHTKGMSHQLNSRDIDEIALTTSTFQNWRENVRIFEDNHINKVGLFPAIEDYHKNPKSKSVGGWIWFNFWYARGAYLAQCPTPAQTSNRYLFEEWLGGDQNDSAVLKSDCYSIYSKSTDFYNATDACTKLEYIRSQLRYSSRLS